MPGRPRHTLLDNPRFYILCIALLVSLAILAVLRLETDSQTLFIIRSEQFYSFISLGLWYLALLISPLRRLLGRRPATDYMVFARRAIGVSAAYYAALHGGIALWGQLGGLAGLSLLPVRYLWALGLGGLALAILLVMAATSFDRIVRLMTYRRWKLLHRLSYLGLAAVIVHVSLIGSHAGQPLVRWGGLAALGLLLLLEASRFQDSLNGPGRKAALIGLSLLTASALPAAAQAHVALSDQSGRYGAVLHIEPADDPVAGRAAGIRFTVRGLSLRDSRAVISVDGDDLPTSVNGSVARAEHTFQAAGVHQLELRVDGRQPAFFQAEQRVGSGRAVAPPQWALAVIVACATVFSALLVIAFNRRYRIHTYTMRASKHLR